MDSHIIDITLFVIDIIIFVIDINKRFQRQRHNANVKVCNI